MSDARLPKVHFVDKVRRRRDELVDSDRALAGHAPRRRLEVLEPRAGIFVCRYRELRKRPTAPARVPGALTLANLNHGRRSA